MKRISIVAPMYNEKDSIPTLAETMTRLSRPPGIPATSWK